MRCGCLLEKLPHLKSSLYSLFLSEWSCASDPRAARVIGSTSPALLLSHHHPLSIISPPRIHYLSHNLHHHLFSPQLDIQARYRRDTIYQWVCLAWKGVIGIFTWPLSRRCLGFARVRMWRDVSNGVWGSKGCRGDNQNSICMHWSFLGQPWMIHTWIYTGSVASAKKEASLQKVYSHLVTIGTRARYRDDNSHLPSLTN